MYSLILKLIYYKDILHVRFLKSILLLIKINVVTKLVG